MSKTKVNHLEHVCGGYWEPISGWSSRYRCTVCKSIGYSRAAAPKSIYNKNGIFIGAPETIVPYMCKVKGCNAFATSRNPQRCKNHKKYE